MSSEVWRLKHLARIRASNVDKKSVDGHLPVSLCNYTDVYNNEEITRSLEFMSATATPVQVKQFTLRANDIILTKDSETPDDIGIPAFVPEDLPGVVCGYHLSTIRVDPAKARPKYIFWALRGHPVRHHFRVGAQGVTRFALGYSDIGDAPIMLPGLSEQDEIVEMLDGVSKKVIALVGHGQLSEAAESPLRKLENLLREYEEAVVTEMITVQGASSEVRARYA